jgi:hypothetical protein
VCGQHHAPAAFIPGKEPVPIVQEAGWAPEPVWIGAEKLAPPGFDPRTFQPVASRYTDYAIPAPNSPGSGVELGYEMLKRNIFPFVILFSPVISEYWFHSSVTSFCYSNIYT